MFASISSRIDGYLHAWGLCKILKLPNLPLDLALEAITKDSDNTSDVGTEPVNKQRGMGNNYERLEFLGDCYLKLVGWSSIFNRYFGLNCVYPGHVYQPYVPISIG
jgi:endoribonuclease Dicer